MCWDLKIELTLEDGENYEAKFWPRNHELELNLHPRTGRAVLGTCDRT